jgi:hypothetical protein
MSTDNSVNIKKILNHLSHEINMFEESYNLINYNLGIECFLLHFRNLYEFFKEKKKYETDINYLDIVNRKINHDLEKYEEIITKINKCLSHFTIERIKYENTEKYPCKSMYTDIMKYYKIIKQ